MDLRVHSFICQNRHCFLRELEGHPVREKVFTTTTPWRGKDYPTAVTRWIGLHQVEFGPRLDGEPVEVEIKLVELSEVSDAGEKLGTSLVTTKTTPGTEEQRIANRKRLNQVIGQILPGYRLAEM